MGVVNKIDQMQHIDNNLKIAVKDFYATARMTTQDIENHLSRLHTVTDVNLNSTNQDLQSFLQNLNNPSPNSSDENLQRVSREFNILNTNFFQCLESHSKSIRRNLLQINNVVDQHNLQIMPYNSLNRKLKEKCLKSSV